jgi:biopolymer transport protein ExbB/TolQ
MFGAASALWALGALGLLVTFVIGERAVFLLRSQGDIDRIRACLNRGLVTRELLQVRRLLNEFQSIEARTLAAGLCATCPDEAELRMQAEGQRQRLRAERNLALLRLPGRGGPLLGILGTVAELARVFSCTSREWLPSVVAGALGEALTPAALGLLVAVPALAAHDAFQRAIHVRSEQARALGREWRAHLHALGRGADPLALVAVNEGRVERPDRSGTRWSFGAAKAEAVGK